MSINQRQIITNTNATMTLSSDTCNVVLAPNKYCAFVAASAGNLAYTCRVVGTGADPKLTGVAEIVRGHLPRF
ncbi:MAG: hypothetical protein IPN42_15345 [Methylococcaceae bacterium]|nr:hypothetical protein [Methylococcaceae bacterium]